jgi:hypothetical protein
MSSRSILSEVVVNNESIIKGKTDFFKCLFFTINCIREEVQWSVSTRERGAAMRDLNIQDPHTSHGFSC